MLNKEYYKDLLVEFAVNDEKLAVTDGVPSKCDETSCAKCEFDDEHAICSEMRKRWANKEYAEPRIHWEDVPVDTPVYVHIKDGITDGGRDIPRHFASYDNKAETIRVFIGGKTSFTIINKHDVVQDTSEYFVSDVTLARTEDTKKYYRR
nr:MAG TPA: hypothetical protein [Caudoviricetes sp.]